MSSTESTVHLSAANPNILLVQKIRDRPADESFGMSHSKIRRLPIVQISLFERLFQIRWACQKTEISDFLIFAYTPSKLE